MRARAAMLFLVLAFTTVPANAQTAGDYVVPAHGPITRHFEPPPTPYSAGHRGIDISAPYGSIVVAGSAGTVHFAGQVGGQLFVSIDHPDGIKTTYSYLSAVLVKKGQVVEQGQTIAYSGHGATGEADNLHFGALRGDVYLDPEALIVDSLRRNVWRVVWLAPDED